MKGGKPMAVCFKTEESRKYQKQFLPYLKEQVKLQGWEKSDNKYQHYIVECDFYFPRVDMDCNNYWKLLADTITESEVVWIDDTQMCERVRSIHIDRNNPRIELTIRPVDYIGIFDNATHLEEFENKCIHCSRYREGKCSILVKSKEGRILEEVTEGICTSYKEKK